MSQTIAEQLNTINNTIARTAERCGRQADKIRLVAVSKKFPSSVVQEASAAGQTLFGENYIQEASQKHDECGSDVDFHFIGHLQTNKTRLACQLFQMIETVDRLKLAKALNKQAINCDKALNILIQVNIGRDPKKSGVLPEQASQLIQDVLQLPQLSLQGLMTMPPFSSDPEESRIHFRALRLLSEDLQEKGLLGQKNQPVELSMGMSNDYTVAIEEGATLVRVGTAIFGTRP